MLLFEASELSSQLSTWLDAASFGSQPARAIIVPHAGYRYSGACAAFGFKQIDSESTVHYVLNCAVYEELKSTGEFISFALGQDEDEHSIEMQFPYIAKVMERFRDRFTIVPIVVGNLSPEREALYGRILAPYLANSSNVFVISSDFCHWAEHSVP
ncbi:unnamed protein product [Echinostoma caproni]|uniref:Protein MEMO1 n=1 Tax=Echinostoma caproni TaxID=27848 RepID=A0A183AUE3_9TREM|nr:unnamed protein product [Echinostoma caproni]